MTIRTDRWEDAVAQLEQLPEGRAKQRLAALMKHVEDGWDRVSALQLLFETNIPEARTQSPMSGVLNFIDADLTDQFRGLAWDAAWLVPGAAREPPRNRTFYPSWDDLDGDLSEFERTVMMLHLASYSSLLPQRFRRVLRRSTEPLLTWGPDFRKLTRTMIRR
jgi:hypothetical protein